jgi:hypothetical protein
MFDAQSRQRAPDEIEEALTAGVVPGYRSCGPVVGPGDQPDPGGAADVPDRWAIDP